MLLLLINRSIYLIDIEGNKLYLERIMGKTFKDMLWSHHSGMLLSAILHLATSQLVFQCIESVSTTKPSLMLKSYYTFFAETEANCKREEFIVICKEIGDLIGKLHNAEVVHGDLTTSNIMVRTIATQLNVLISPSEETSSHSEAAVTQAVAPAATVNESAHTPGKVVLIDFGLGMMKPSVDDKAVDLYVLERAFIATHPGSEHLVSIVVAVLLCSGACEAFM